MSPAAAPAPTGKLSRTIADWIVNDNEQGDTFTILKDGELYVPTATLDEFGAQGLSAGKRFHYLSEDYVSLDSLKPDLAYTWDPDQHLITVKISASRFLPTEIDLKEPRPTGIQFRHSASGFMNYDLHESLDGSQRSTSLALDSALSLGPGDFDLAGELAAARFSTSSFSYTINNPSNLTQFQLGQVSQNARTAVPGTLIGFTFGRKFQLDPYLNTVPIPSLMTAVTSPSTVYIYVNGRLIKTANVAPGILDLSNIPMPDGTNDATVVIDGSSGKQTLNLPFYGTSANLAKGLTDFQLAAALAPAAHGPVLSSFFRRGLSNAFTEDLELVGAPGYARGGSALDVRTRIGAFHGAYDQSKEAGGSGGRADLRYDFSGKPFSIGAEVSRSASGFSQGGWTGGAGPAPVGLPQLDESIYLGINGIRNASPYLRWQRQADSSQNTSSATLGSGFRVGRGSLTLALTRQSNPNAVSFAATFSTKLGRANATESYDSSTHDSSLRLETQRKDGSGSTTVTADVPSLDRVLLDSNATWNKGTFALSMARDAGVFSGDLDYQGAIGLVGSRVFEARPIDNGFALVRVPGLAGVDVSLEGRDLGRTDGQGDLIVPDLVSGFANTIKINDDDLPLDYHFDKTRQIVSPIGRSGIVVNFPHTRVQTYRGHLYFLVAGKQVAPVDGTVTYRANGKDVSVDLSEGGMLYLNDIEPGTYALHLEADNGVCDASVVLMKSAAAFTTFQPVTCTPQPVAP